MKLTHRLSLATVAIAILLSTSPAMADLKFGVAAEPYSAVFLEDFHGQVGRLGSEYVMDAVCAEMKEKCEITEVAWDGIVASR